MKSQPKASAASVPENAVTNMGIGLAELSHRSPVLVVFLRHSGCPFCREALSDIAKNRKEIEKSGVSIVLVHMSSDEQAERFFASYGLDDLPRISDPDCDLYRQFGLERGTHGQVAGPKIWWQGFKTTILKRHGFGRIIGDVLQMPGSFLIQDGKIAASFQPSSSAERPDYVELSQCRLPDNSP